MISMIRGNHAAVMIVIIMGLQLDGVSNGSMERGGNGRRFGGIERVLVVVVVVGMRGILRGTVVGPWQWCGGF
mgnify:CR=1 FL=1